MNKTIFQLISFLRAGVLNLAVDKIDGEIDWRGLHELAVRQNVLPLVFDGYQLYFEKSGLDAPKLIKFQWYASTQQAERHYRSHLHAIKTLCGYFAENGIRTMILKGYSLSICYPRPEHRPCGDIDIYLFGDWKKADSLLEKNAHVVINRTHHHHTMYKWNGIYVENHYDFINLFTHTINKKLDVFLKKIAATEKYQTCGDFLIPSPNLSALFVFFHSVSDFAGTAINVRKIVDWYLLKRQYGNGVEWEKIEKICKELDLYGIYRIWNNVTKFVMEGGIELSEVEKKVLHEIFYPKFNKPMPKSLIPLMLWKLRRWWESRWKMKLVYPNENMLNQFVVHSYSHLLRPERMIK